MRAQWGDDHSLIGGWALRGALAWRILLPAESATGRISWQEMAELHDNPSPSDGYVTWGEITAWKGTGPSGPADCTQPSFPDDDVARTFQECLTGVVGHQLWTSETGLAPLEKIMLRWQRHRNLGRWSCSRIGLAAPAFADSAIISGPDSLGAVLLQHGLEAWPIASSLALPPMIS